MGCATNATVDDDAGPSDDDDTPGDDDASADDDDALDDDSAQDDDVGDDDSAPDDDQDGDGWSEAAGDCDDTDASVHPDAEEVPCDAVDNDCDGYGILSGAVVGSVEYATVPHALNAAVDGETIYVCPGVHVGQLYTDDERALTITSYSGNRDETVLDGAGLETVVYVGEDNQVALSHLTIRNGLGQPWLSGDYAGGGVMAFGVSTSIVDCVFIDNAVDQPGGRGGAVAARRSGGDASSVTIEGCHFESNTALGEGGNGGAVYSSSIQTPHALSISNSTFVTNSSDRTGGAVYATGNNVHAVTVSIEDCAFDSNETGNSGGVLYLYVWNSLLVSNSVFTGNHAGYQGGAVSLGEPQAEPSVVEVSDCTFTENSSDQSGGAFHASTGNSESVSLCLDTCTFSSNSAQYGASLALDGSGEYVVAFDDVNLEGNIASVQGGGLQLYSTDNVQLQMTGGSFTGNESDVNGAAAFLMSLDGSCLAEFDGVLFEDNVVTTDELGALTCSTNCACTLRDSTVHTNTGGGAWIGNTTSNSSLTSIDTDWGTGVDDNTPYDVQIYEGDTYAAFGPNETFTCTAELGCI